MHYLLVAVLTTGSTEAVADRLRRLRFHRVDLIILPVVFLADVLVFSRMLRIEGATAAERVAIVIYSGAGIGLLLLRWRAPVAVYIAAVVLALPPLLISDYYIPFLIPLVALAAVAQLRPPRVSLWCLAASVLPIALLVGKAVLQASPSGRLPSAAGSAVFYSAGFVLAWGLGQWIGRNQRRLEQIRVQHELEVREQQKLAENAVSVERLRIARELHDIVAHSVTIMVLHAAGARRVVRTDPDRAAESLTTIEESGQQAMTELRRLLALLRESDDGPDRVDAMVPGLAHVDQILAQVRNSGVRVTLEISGQPARLDASVDLAAYRLIQEGITNVTKHCGTGAQVAVTVEWGAEKVTVAVEDDGLGVRSAAPAGGGGHGLAGLRERIAIAAGEFSAGPTESGGFRVAARLPVSTGSPIPPPAKASRPVEEHLGVDR
ncbi:histidine kinase [Nakamurella multipartita DSM 44233]|uniref:histidine kinase n=1 Tax=Nakamurella multipartita (strain ATCC 700099 / DSM 44233 / CIP 104796 / JCM 9543 / NBRC 105858 / Y-104) TaxID=479431 RepID=C8X846_NAKMY|nr:histidine kinase [Nakamurella multipartita DSM 44233]